MNINELRALLDLAKEYNLKSLKTKDIELHFEPKLVPFAMPVGGTSEKVPTEDQFMFMATEGLPAEVAQGE